MDDEALKSPAPTSTRTTGLPKRTRRLQDAQDKMPTSAVSRTRPERQGKALDLAIQCARIADDNRGRDILLLDIRQTTPLMDYFVLTTAASRRQATAISIEIDMIMKREGEEKLGIEGAEEGRWILMDYGDFVIHIFSTDARAYYSLEDVWGDAPRLEWQDPNRPRPELRPQVLDEPDPEPTPEATVSKAEAEASEAEAPESETKGEAP